LRGDLRILPMSATLDGARVAQLLGDAPVIASEGRAFPVETRYLGRDQHARIEDQMTDAVLRALRAETGSILAFLPGQAEIRRVEERLKARIDDPAVALAPLYGAMDTKAQDLALRPAAKGTRKVVLATSIAETSITIEGVRVVIDSGLARVPRFEPEAGITRLETVRVSRAAADQRRGRAGRTEPGVCYRLWDARQTQALAAFAEPEIRTADLAGLLLDCADWGATDPRTLAWIDPPTIADIDAAREELTRLEALDADGRITAVGRRLRSLPLPPRLARMVIAAADLRHAQDAAEIAAVIVERGLGGNDVDLADRLDRFRGDRGRRAGDMRRLASGWAQMAARMASRGGQSAKPPGEMSAARLLALAYPERIAKARGALGATLGQYLLANGRGAYLEPMHPLARSPFLVVAELSGAAASTRILLAAAADEADVLAAAGSRVRESAETDFDTSAAALRSRRVRRLDGLVLASSPQAVAADDATARLLAEGIAKLGIGRLPWSKAQLQLRDRVGFLRGVRPSGSDTPAPRATGEAAEWPDLSDAALAETAAEWLAPFLTAKTRLSEIGADDLGAALDALLPWHLKRRLDDEAPTHFEAPTGNRHAIDYEGAGAPALHIRVQELFGLREHPAIAGGRLPLTLNLLSPAHRPIQITRDLPGFWKGSWAAVKAEMKGRYPRHPWPDDPASAVPTARAKPRGS
jgi:ATP-dependent helicase HrpB